MGGEGVWRGRRMEIREGEGIWRREAWR